MENSPEQLNGGYDESNITVLEGLEAVRLRPGMYIGGVDSAALHHLVFEIVDNSVDEALAGYCNEVRVSPAGMLPTVCRTIKLAHRQWCK